jgi:hypothetical protein
MKWQNNIYLLFSISFLFILSITVASAWSTNNLNVVSCYQESVNTTDQSRTDGYCGLNYTSGNYISTEINATDGNWTSYANVNYSSVISDGGVYTKPINATGATWIVKIGSSNGLSSEIYNLTIPADCFNLYSYRVVLKSTFKGLTLSCQDSTGYTVLLNKSDYVYQYLYEEAFLWNMSDYNFASEDLNLTGNKTITRFLAVPSTVSKIVTALMNITTIMNLSNRTVSLGNPYSTSGVSTVYITRANDGDWTNTGWMNNANSYIYENYTSNSIKPIRANFTFKTALFTGGGHNGNFNLYYYNYTSFNWISIGGCSYLTVFDNTNISTCSFNIPSDGLNKTIQVKINITYDVAGGLLGSTGYYEGAMTIQDIGGINVTINNQSIYDTGDFNFYSIQVKNRTNNFATYINSYLSICNYIDNFCNVPINFYSDNTGILSYLDMFFSSDGLNIINSTYSSNSFETQSESFNLNVTYDNNAYTSSIANLVYNGTSYSSTKTGSDGNYLFSKTIDLPLINYPTQNISFYWNISLTNSSGTYSFLSSNYYQIVNRTYLYICNLTYTVPYVNFTFQEETLLNSMNASIDEANWNYYLGSGSVYKTYSFINVSTNPAYAFCYSPSYKNVNTVLQYLKYSATGYPQRQYFYNSSYTNTTTNTILGLLSSSNGIYTSIQTLKGVGSPLDGVLVVAERFYGGSYLTVGTGITDEAGIVTFWVNPNYPLRLTATKVGYPTTQVTINPSQTQYSLYMGTTSGNTTYSMSTNGLRWNIFPANGLINTNTFGMNMTAYYSNIVSCKLDLVRSDDLTTLTSTTTVGGSDCNISLTYTIPSGVRVFGQFYVWTTESGGYFLIDSDALWYNLTTSTPSPWTNIQSLFHDLNSMPEFGTDQLRQQFSKVIIFFFVLILLIGILCFFTEYDRLYPGFFVVIAWIIIFIASKGGFLTLDFGSAITNTTISNTMKQYMVAMITGLFTFGYVINRFTRDS